MYVMSPHIFIECKHVKVKIILHGQMSNLWVIVQLGAFVSYSDSSCSILPYKENWLCSWQPWVLTYHNSLNSFGRLVDILYRVISQRVLQVQWIPIQDKSLSRLYLAYDHRKLMREIFETSELFFLGVLSLVYELPLSCMHWCMMHVTLGIRLRLLRFLSLASTCETRDKTGKSGYWMIMSWVGSPVLASCCDKEIKPAMTWSPSFRPLEVTFSLDHWILLKPVLEVMNRVASLITTHEQTQ